MKIRKKNPETNEIKIQNKGFFYVPHFHSFHSSSHIESKKSIFDVAVRNQDVKLIKRK